MTYYWHVISGQMRWGSWARSGHKPDVWDPIYIYIYICAAIDLHICLNLIVIPWSLHVGPQSVWKHTTAPPTGPAHITQHRPIHGYWFLLTQQPPLRRQKATMWGRGASRLRLTSLMSAVCVSEGGKINCLFSRWESQTPACHSGGGSGRWKVHINQENSVTQASRMFTQHATAWQQEKTSSAADTKHPSCASVQSSVRQTFVRRCWHVFNRAVFKVRGRGCGGYVAIVGVGHVQCTRPEIN